MPGKPSLHGGVYTVMRGSSLHILVSSQVHAIPARCGIQLRSQAEGHSYGGDAERPYGAATFQVSAGWYSRVQDRVFVI